MKSLINQFTCLQLLIADIAMFPFSSATRIPGWTPIVSGVVGCILTPGALSAIKVRCAEWRVINEAPQRW